MLLAADGLAEALAYVHGSGLAHGHVRPSNIMAVDNHLKFPLTDLASAECAAAGGRRVRDDAPELNGSGLSRRPISGRSGSRWLPSFRSVNRN